MAENLPYLPDGSPNPDYDYKKPPGYLGPSEQEKGITQGLGYGGPSDQYTQGTGSIWDALQKGGGYSAVMPHLGKLADFMKKGGQAAEKYETAATKRLQQTGQAAFKGIQAQMGGQGALGSTTHLGGLGDLGAKYAGERANIGATAAGMKESNMMNRMQAGMSGLSQLGSLASYEQMNALQGGGQLAQLGMQQQGMGQQMNLQQLGALQGQRMEPYQVSFDKWTANQRAPKGGGALPYLGAAADIGTSMYGAGMFGNPWGGGGGGGGWPQGPNQMPR